jgi:hypothetical protein
MRRLNITTLEEYYHYTFSLTERTAERQHMLDGYYQRGDLRSPHTRG